MTFYLPFAGLKKVNSGSPPGKRDIHAGQLTFKADSNKIIIIHLRQTRNGLGQAKCHGCLPKGQAGIHFFFQALHQKHSLGLYCFFGLFVYICSTAYANDTEMTPYP